MILLVVELRRSWTSSARLPVMLTGARRWPASPSFAAGGAVSGVVAGSLPCAATGCSASDSHDATSAAAARARAGPRGRATPACGQSIDGRAGAAVGLTRSSARMRRARQRPTARSSSAFVIFERPLMFAFAASA
jgi:hypothetical protein